MHGSPLLTWVAFYFKGGDWMFRVYYWTDNGGINSIVTSDLGQFRYKDIVKVAMLWD